MRVTIENATWKMSYNGLNQLTQRHNGSTWDGGTERYGYSYDANGDLTQVLKETKSGTWSQAEKWVYEWNPRDQ